MPSTRGERLRIARSKRFKSARSAAASLGIPPATYGAHERAELPGGRDYGGDEAITYGRHFDVSPGWLLTGNRSDLFTGLRESRSAVRPMGFDPQHFAQRLADVVLGLRGDVELLERVIEALRHSEFKNLTSSDQISLNIERLLSSLEASRGLTFSLANELDRSLPGFQLTFFDDRAAKPQLKKARRRRPKSDYKT
jgi:hypothetical protein